MESKRTGIGLKGEELAFRFLTEKGFKVLERNFRCPLGEIDIIGREGDVIVFVEVRTRRSYRFGSPVESVDVRKQKRLSHLALYYLKVKGMLGRAARFDVVGITLGEKEEVDINWIRDAFDFQG